MSSLTNSQIVGGSGANNQQVWVPAPYSKGTAQAGGSSSSGGTSGTGTSVAQSGAAASVSFSATCTASDAVGACVYATSAAPAVATVTDQSPYPAVGVITAKASATSCTVQSFGLCTVYSGLTANARYFVGDNGQPALLSALSSQAPFLQAVGFAVGASALFVQPSGVLYQRSGSTNAGGQPASGTPSSSVQATYYGGILYGTDAPAASLGSTGDSYLQYGADGSIALWGPKTDDGWGSGVSLIGQAGNSITVAQTAPTTSAPRAGDLWLNNANNDAVLYAAS